MDWINSTLRFIVNSLLQELVVVVFGVLIAQQIYNRWVDWQYGGWQVIILEKGEEILKRDVSPHKAKEVLGEPADLAVFLKGVVSPYGWINCDILAQGKDVGLFKLINEGRLNRRFVIDLDQNPQTGARRSEGP